jgi:NIMA (never in mitosis gene a)-related kinase
MALQYVHSRRVIHRDIKTQNVFLTGSKTIKVGDFGISKVLESTTQVAMTVVGTPYYMSPESCQSEPYTSKSDVWALGIILFELCSLKQPFQADNLLGLVFKIVQDNPEPIPDCYSPELRELVAKLLCKNPANRPSTAEILKMPYVTDRMRSFVENAEMDAMLQSGVYKKQRPTIVRSNTRMIAEEFHPGQASLNTTASSTANAQSVTLTPKQLMEKRK